MDRQKNSNYYIYYECQSEYFEERSGVSNISLYYITVLHILAKAKEIKLLNGKPDESRGRKVRSLNIY